MQLCTPWGILVGRCSQGLWRPAHPSPHLTACAGAPCLLEAPVPPALGPPWVPGSAPHARCSQAGACAGTAAPQGPPPAPVLRRLGPGSRQPHGVLVPPPTALHLNLHARSHQGCQPVLWPKGAGVPAGTRAARSGAAAPTCPWSASFSCPGTGGLCCGPEARAGGRARGRGVPAARAALRALSFRWFTRWFLSHLVNGQASRGRVQGTLVLRLPAPWVFTESFFLPPTRTGNSFHLWDVAFHAVNGTTGPLWLPPPWVECGATLGLSGPRVPQGWSRGRGE